MWPFIRDGLVKFFTDKQAFAASWDRWVVKVRSVLMGAGAAVAIYGDQIEKAAPPALQGKVKMGGVLLMALSLALRAGDKTPENIKQLSKDMTPPRGTPLVEP